MTSRDCSRTKGRNKKQDSSEGDLTPFEADSTALTDADGHAHQRSAADKLPIYKSIYINGETGEQTVIECTDPQQLEMALKGTAKALDKAILNINKSRKEQFAMPNQANCQKVTTNEQLSDVDIRVWDFCKNDVMYGNEISSTQVEIADALSIHARTVNRSFSRFRKLKLIEKSRVIKGTPTYRINDEYLIKGKRELHGTKKMADVIYADFVNKKLAEQSA